jgi:hypothetical protein
MSEAELHILRARMYQGRLNEARRGEVYYHPPIGHVRIVSSGQNFLQLPWETWV